MMRATPVGTGACTELVLPIVNEAEIPAATVSRPRVRSPDDVVQQVLAGPRRQQQGGVLRCRSSGDKRCSQLYTWVSLANHSCLELRNIPLFQPPQNPGTSTIHLNFDQGDLLVAGGSRLMQIGNNVFVGVVTPRGSVFLLKFFAAIENDGSSVFGNSAQRLSRNPNASFQTSRFELPGSDSSTDATWLVNCAEWKLLEDGKVHVTIGCTNGSVFALNFESGTFPSSPSVVQFHSSSGVKKLFTGLVKRAMGTNDNEVSSCVVAVQVMKCMQEFFVLSLGVDGKLSIWSVANQSLQALFQLEHQDVSELSIESATVRVLNIAHNSNSFKVALVCQVTGKGPVSWMLEVAMDSASGKFELSDCQYNFIHCKLGSDPETESTSYYGMRLADLVCWGNKRIVSLWWDETTVGTTALFQHPIAPEYETLAVDTLQLSEERVKWNEQDGLLEQCRNWDEMCNFVVGRLSIPGRYTSAQVRIVAERLFGLRVCGNDDQEDQTDCLAVIDSITSYIQTSSSNQTGFKTGPTSSKVNLDVASRMLKLVLNDCAALIDEETQPLVVSLPEQSPDDETQAPNDVIVVLKSNAFSIMRQLGPLERVSQLRDVQVEQFLKSQDEISVQDGTFSRFCLNLVQNHWSSMFDLLVIPRAHRDGPEAFLLQLTKRCKQISLEVEDSIGAYFESLIQTHGNQFSSYLHQLVDAVYRITTDFEREGGNVPNVPHLNASLVGRFTCKSISNVARTMLHVSFGALFTLCYVARACTTRHGAKYAQCLLASNDDRESLDCLLLRGSVLCHNFSMLLEMSVTGSKVGKVGGFQSDIKLPASLLPDRHTRLGDDSVALNNSLAKDRNASVLEHLILFAIQTSSLGNDATSLMEQIEAATNSTIAMVHRNVNMYFPASLAGEPCMTLVMRGLGQHKLLLNLLEYVSKLKSQAPLGPLDEHIPILRLLDLLDAETRLGFLMASQQPSIEGIESKAQSEIELAIADFHRCSKAFDVSDGDEASNKEVVEYYLALAKYASQIPLPKAASSLSVFALSFAGNTGASDTLKSILASSIFSFAIQGPKPDYRLALHAVVVQAEPSMRAQYVRQLTALLLERREYEALCALPLTDHQDLFDQVLKSIVAKANWSQVSKDIGYYHVWHMFCFNAGNYVGSAEAMYRYASRLEVLVETQISNGKPLESVRELCVARMNALASCCGCLRLVHEDHSVLMMESARKFKTRESVDEEDDIPPNTICPLTISDIEREFSLAHAIVKVLELGGNPYDANSSETTSDERVLYVLNWLLDCDCIQDATDLCTAFGMDMEPFGTSDQRLGIFGALTVKCVNSGNDSGPHWDILRSLLEKFDVVPIPVRGGKIEKLPVYKYHQVVLDVFLEEAQRLGKGPTGDFQPIPEWLMRSFKSWCAFASASDPGLHSFAAGRSHPVACIELLMRYGRLLEAAELYYELIPTSAQIQDHITRFVSDSTWLPIALFDNLIAALSQEAASVDNPTRVLLESAQSQLEVRMKEFFKVSVSVEPLRSNAFMRHAGSTF